MEVQSSSDANGAGDPFKLISGFYGPGALAAWYLVVGAVLVTWICNRYFVVALTADVYAAILYPIIAIGHLIIQLEEFPPDKIPYLVVSLMNNMLGGAESPASLDTTLFQEFKADISSSEASQINAQIASINAAFAISEVCSSLILIAFLFYKFRASGPYMSGVASVGVSLLMILVLSWVPKFLLMVQIGNHPGWLFLLVLFSTFFRSCFWVGVLAALSLFGVFLRLWHNWSILEHLPSDVNKIQFLFHFLMTRKRVILDVLGAATALIMAIWFPGRLFMPLSGIAISELDQAAALAGGIITLLTSVSSALGGAPGGAPVRALEWLYSMWARIMH